VLDACLICASSFFCTQIRTWFVPGVERLVGGLATGRPDHRSAQTPILTPAAMQRTPPRYRRLANK
jgi:hypothetical protein